MFEEQALWNEEDCVCVRWLACGVDMAVECRSTSELSMDDVQCERKRRLRRFVAAPQWYSRSYCTATTAWFARIM